MPDDVIHQEIGEAFAGLPEKYQSWAGSPEHACACDPEKDALSKRVTRLEAALRKIARSDEYKGADSVATKLGRAMDIARRALRKSEAGAVMSRDDAPLDQPVDSWADWLGKSQTEFNRLPHEQQSKHLRQISEMYSHKLAASDKRIAELEAALREIHGSPCAFQDDANAANMRAIAWQALSN